jgi:hypothetical protein
MQEFRDIAGLAGLTIVAIIVPESPRVQPHRGNAQNPRVMDLSRDLLHPCIEIVSWCPLRGKEAAMRFRALTSAGIAAFPQERKVVKLELLSADAMR